ncbi:hypothetical protein [Mechercharimyces sp. CAU 1602]|uniref:DUF7948 domain-containing protein n=1 Tax=Mechercharimyces sp. CAU 1602 TaxID=2973933 RepID=UPI0021620617|nr:hypothetical protein [Mechercharimyces sp. CAU 1602]MCS1350670.1 hypothetical protein [Mechercharimyces sp. CAU 1602]
MASDHEQQQGSPEEKRAGEQAQKNDAQIKHEVMQKYGKIPLTFVPNQGQLKAEYSLYATGSGFRFAFLKEKVILTFYKRSKQEQPEEAKADEQGIKTAEQLERSALGRRKKEASLTKTEGINLILRFVDAATVEPRGQKEAGGKVNYFRGRKKENWVRGLPMYKEVVYEGLWPGVDATFHGRKGQLKYDFTVQADAEIDKIRLFYGGADKISLNDEGKLEIHTPYGIIYEEKPVSYQMCEGEQKEVATRFCLYDDQTIGFALEEEADSSLPLTIDPALHYLSLVTEID